MTTSSSLGTIEDFLAQKRIAMVGVSRNPVDFSVQLFEEFTRRGYDMVPVNPNASEVQGKACFAHLRDVEPPVDAVLVMTSSAAAEAVVRECAEAGIRRVWLYRGTGAGAVSEAALAFCKEQGIRVVPGECPFMFLPGASGVHRFHGFLRKITGHYPRHEHAAESGQ